MIKELMMVDMISFDDWQKMDIRIAKIESAEKIEGADKLLKLNVSLGDEKRELVAGIAEFYAPEELVDKMIPILANLEPKQFKGVTSHGMILAVEEDGKAILLKSEKEVREGSKVM
ncbi:MAG: methionine--tRNA ligase subunit beta [Nanoarchaeota archaeon]